MTVSVHESPPTTPPPTPATGWVRVVFDADKVRCNAWAAFQSHPMPVQDAAGDLHLATVRRAVEVVDGVTDWLPTAGVVRVTPGHDPDVVAWRVLLTLEAHARTDLTPAAVAALSARLGLVPAPRTAVAS